VRPSNAALPQEWYGNDKLLQPAMVVKSIQPVHLPAALGDFLKRLYLWVQSLFPPAKGGRPKGGGVKSERSNHPGAARHPSLAKEGNPYPPMPDFPV